MFTATQSNIIIHFGGCFRVALNWEHGKVNTEVKINLVLLQKMEALAPLSQVVNNDKILEMFWNIRFNPNKKVLTLPKHDFSVFNFIF